MKKVLAVIGFTLAVVAMSQVASAATITLTVGAGGSFSTDLILGEVFTPGDLAGGLAVRDAAAVNGLLAVAPGVRAGTDPEYYRAAGSGTGYAAATSVGANFLSPVTDGPATISITLTNTYLYLIGTYDGPNGGAQVWYIASANVGDTIVIPRYAEPLGTPQNLAVSERYLMTSYTLLNPVPDGGATAALLGLGVLGLGFLRRRKG